MKNMQIAGTGNSRWMKSAISETATWEEFRAMLRAGTFPFDFNGINEEGIVTKGTPYDVDNILKDSTAASLGGDETMVPDEAIALLKKMVDLAQSTASAAGRFAVVSYVGTVSSSSGVADVTIQFPFIPRVVVMPEGNQCTAGIFINPSTESLLAAAASATQYFSCSWDNENKRFTEKAKSRYTGNGAGTTYYCFGFGYEE